MRGSIFKLTAVLNIKSQLHSENVTTVSVVVTKRRL